MNVTFTSPYSSAQLDKFRSKPRSTGESPSVPKETMTYQSTGVGNDTAFRLDQARALFEKEPTTLGDRFKGAAEFGAVLGLAGLGISLATMGLQSSVVGQILTPHGLGWTRAVAEPFLPALLLGGTGAVTGFATGPLFKGD